ncbi:hypothetical protein EYF80_058999 [Liparis tanakae]|uniref:Uncharacterized protein n=1 Tax=Liparis tanakae TaxID=230148 RepID=A0A4Z2EPX1_9TELE|nr:hypothetical protein EYF80_058999 [Liparis tanakae]
MAEQCQPALFVLPGRAVRQHLQPHKIRRPHRTDWVNSNVHNAQQKVSGGRSARRRPNTVSTGEPEHNGSA